MSKKTRHKDCRRVRSKVWLYAEISNWLTVLVLSYLMGVLTGSIFVITTVWIFGKYIYCYIIESILKIRHDLRGLR
jgi:hypothetical protein